MENKNDVSSVISDMLKEDFFDGGARQNITGGTDIATPGERANLMLAGILMGAGPATVFDMPTNNQFAGFNQLVIDQANGKMGRKTSAAQVVEALLSGNFDEDTDDELSLADITALLKEEGFTDIANYVDEAYTTPTRDASAGLKKIAENFEKAETGSVMAKSLNLMAQDVAVLSVLAENNISFEAYMSDKVDLNEALSKEDMAYITESLND